MFNSERIGEPALEAFNAFGADRRTKDVPAVLLLGQEHHSWRARADEADHRIVVPMPVRFSQVQALLDRLARADDEEPSDATS